MLNLVNLWFKEIRDINQWAFADAAPVQKCILVESVRWF